MNEKMTYNIEDQKNLLKIFNSVNNDRPTQPESALKDEKDIIYTIPIADFDDSLEDYFRRTVIGGSGAFVIVANGFKDFARAIVRKLILEIYISRRGEAGGRG